MLLVELTISLFRLYASTIVHRKYANCSVVDSDQTVNIGLFKHCGLRKKVSYILNKEHCDVARAYFGNRC